MKLIGYEKFIWWLICESSDKGYRISYQEIYDVWSKSFRNKNNSNYTKFLKSAAIFYKNEIIKCEHEACANTGYPHWFNCTFLKIKDLPK